MQRLLNGTGHCGEFKILVIINGEKNTMLVVVEAPSDVSMVCRVLALHFLVFTTSDALKKEESSDDGLVGAEPPCLTLKPSKATSQSFHM